MPAETPVTESVLATPTVTQIAEVESVAPSAIIIAETPVSPVETVSGSVTPARAPVSPTEPEGEEVVAEESELEDSDMETASEYSEDDVEDNETMGEASSLRTSERQQKTAGKKCRIRPVYAGMDNTNDKPRPKATGKGKAKAKKGGRKQKRRNCCQRT